MTRKNTTQTTISLPLLLVMLAVVIRVIGAQMGWFPPNFSIVGAMALFAGAILQPRWLGMIVTALAVVGSNLVMGHQFTPWLVSFAYLPFVLIALLAGFAKPDRSIVRWVGGTLMASIVFFVVSNFGVWCFASQTYDRSITGIVACYTAALPFFHNTLAGDFVFSAVLFGSYAVLTGRVFSPTKLTEPGR